MTLINPSATTSLGPVEAVRPPEHLDEVARRIEARLRTVLDAELTRWTVIDPDLGPPITSLRRLVLDGGKRLRPAFCEWGFVAAGGDLDDPAGRDAVDAAGVAFELLHAFALVHDDVMDGSDRRRGAPTAHIEFAERHAEGAWRGETRRFGESAAILIGDLAHVWANEAMADQPAAALAVWRELQTELMMGQYLDVLGTARGDRAPAKARLIVRLKSGRYTVEQPLRLGAALATGRWRPDDLDAAPTTRADGDTIEATLAAYGAPIGEAFQLRDDVLGAFGVATTIGKPVGDDLREGKPTPLLAYAVEHASRAQRIELDRVGTPELDDDDIRTLQAILVDTGALRAIESSIITLTDRAIASLDVAAIPAAAWTALTDLARFIAARES